MLPLQVIAAGVVVEARSMEKWSIVDVTVTIENEFVDVGQKLDFHCVLLNTNSRLHRVVKDFGAMTLMPLTHWSTSFKSSSFPLLSQDDTITFTFSPEGKPTTTIDVYTGNSPSIQRLCDCNINLGTCLWQALNEGFWCNSLFVQKWGKAWQLIISQNI